MSQLLQGVIFQKAEIFVSIFFFIQNDPQFRKTTSVLLYTFSKIIGAGDQHGIYTIYILVYICRTSSHVAYSTADLCANGLVNPKRENIFYGNTQTDLTL